MYDCQKPQILSEGEKTFFESKGLVLPKRFKPCRTKKKQSFEKPQEYWEKPVWQR